MARKKVAKISKKEARAREASAVETPFKVSETPEIKEKKKIAIQEIISIKDLATRMNLPVTDIIKQLFKNGIATTINEDIDFETALIIGDDLGFEIEKEEEPVEQKNIEKAVLDQSKDIEERPPIITIMGHVDHGKTSILDFIRQTHVVQRESGGITQHIGAYQAIKKDRLITFIDTPGHQAFSAMRAHGANITDIVVLVVAADDGVRPQTIEAIDHAKVANVPIIVAINKIDKPGADPERVKNELTEYGLIPEEWGGETIEVPVSAKTGDGIDELLEMILLVADLKEYKANSHQPALGVVVESHLEKGKGPLATVLIQNGTLNLNDNIVIGSTSGKVKTLEDYNSGRLKQAGPSMPVQISGLSAVPEVGEQLVVVQTEKEAKRIAELNTMKEKAHRSEGLGRARLESMAEKIKSGEIKELKLILKVDVKGSLQAVEKLIEDLKSQEVVINVLNARVGSVTESDVMLAKTTGAIIFAFRTDIPGEIKKLADNNQVLIQRYDVIYELFDDIKGIVVGLLPPKLVETEVGKLKVIKIFRLSNKGIVAGCVVEDGRCSRSDLLKITRDGKELSRTKVLSLRREKEEIREAIAGSECGVAIEPNHDVLEGDLLICYQVEEVKQEL